jgi:predicted nucleic acid-binding protein
VSLLYFDSSALVKLVVLEPETPALLSLLESRAAVVSSAIAQVEVLRSVRRAGGSPEARTRARDVLSRVVLFAVDDPILEAAAALEPADVRSLNAIHLATALALGRDADGFVCYDGRLNEAAGSLALRVVSPQ